MNMKKYKGYKKILQEKVFHGSRTKINVTLIELSKQNVSLELADRPKELGMKQERLLYRLSGRDRSKWFVSFVLEGYKVNLQLYAHQQRHYDHSRESEHCSISGGVPR